MKKVSIEASCANCVYCSDIKGDDLGHVCAKGGSIRENKYIRERCMYVLETESERYANAADRRNMAKWGRKMNPTCSTCAHWRPCRAADNLGECLAAEVKQAFTPPEGTCDLYRLIDTGTYLFNSTYEPLAKKGVVEVN